MYLFIYLFLSVTSTNVSSCLQDQVLLKCPPAVKFLVAAAAVSWCIDSISLTLSGCVKLTAVVRVGGTAETRETVATAAVTEAGAVAATTAVVAAAATTAAAAMTTAAEADLLVWGKLHCATAPLRYLNVVWKMCHSVGSQLHLQRLRLHLVLALCVVAKSGVAGVSYPGCGDLLSLD